MLFGLLTIIYSFKCFHVPQRSFSWAPWCYDSATHHAASERAFEHMSPAMHLSCVSDGLSNWAFKLIRLIQTSRLHCDLVEERPLIGRPCRPTFFFFVHNSWSQAVLSSPSWYCFHFRAAVIHSTLNFNFFYFLQFLLLTVFVETDYIWRVAGPPKTFHSCLVLYFFSRNCH